jgi:prepilin-type N-terminal cleavage/methylation domain-containing protein
VKRKTVKGFTLIELIVVMAIFGIVMAAAMSLMKPVSDMAILADVRDSGTAQVNSISSYLQTQLGAVEYLMVTNDATLSTTVTYTDKDGNDHTIPAVAYDSTTGNPVEPKMNDYVNAYVRRYYEGVLKKGSQVNGTLTYGTGKVHALMVDNTNGGILTEWIYDVKFDLVNNYIVGDPAIKPYVVNKAYYQNTRYTIELGTTGGQLMANTVDNFAAATDMSTFLNSLTATDTTFKITADVKKGTVSPKYYSFETTATAPLVNIMNRPGCVTGKYFVVSQSKNTTTNTVDSAIVDISSHGVSYYDDTDAVRKDFTLSRKAGGLETMSSIYCLPDTSKPVSGEESVYIFVYSFGNEMLTS